MAKLTKRIVDQAAPGTVRYILFDEDVKGLGLRVSPSGAKTWILEYRPGTGGRKVSKRRLKLGPVGTFTPDEARRLARQALSAVYSGKDPAREQSKDRASKTLSEVISAYLTDHALAKRKPRTAEHYRDVLERIVAPALGGRKANAIQHSDIANLHLNWRHTPSQANRMLAIVSSMYGFAAKRNMVPVGYNPARGVEKYPEKGRERFLTSEELAALGDALREAETIGIGWQIDESLPTAKHVPKANRRTVLAPHAVAAIRLLIFTGARLREILHLRWTEVDLGRGLLLLPDSKTGRKTIILNADALALLIDLPRIGSFVIAGDNPEAPRADLKRPWQLISRHAGLTGVRLHDLRHTYASVGAGSGLGLPVIGKLLGHADSRTTERYAHLDNDPLRNASNAIGRRLSAALGDGEAQGGVSILEER
jgi:integrase